VLRAVGRAPALLAGPLICWLLGHHWHTWLGVITTMRVCDRCGFMVDDPRHH
jgi:hypothetical protein